MTAKAGIGLLSSNFSKLHLPNLYKFKHLCQSSALQISLTYHLFGNIPEISEPSGWSPQVVSPAGSWGQVGKATAEVNEFSPPALLPLNKPNSAAEFHIRL